jgi:hypothetical protein
LTNSFTEAEVLRACQILFGTEIHVTGASCSTFSLKAAYRKKAKEPHPDLFA